MRLRALLLVAFIFIAPTPGAAAPEGQMTWAVHISLAPTWFDPAETPGIGTPFMILYALHDALVKPMPGNSMAPSLAESWSASKDGLVYEFVLRQGVRFHNGDPVTADDVKFSFERYRGAASRLLKERVPVHEKAVYAPIWELGFIHAQGPRVAESGLGLITGWAFSAPYEDVRLKGK